MGKHISEEQRERWVSLLCQAADEAGVPADPEFRSAFMAYIEWGSRLAVEKSDAPTMDRLLADDYVLVLGNGRVFQKTDLLAQARDANWKYEHQSDTRQTVRFWDSTAVLTALLWIKGLVNGRQVDVEVWFSDTYACTPKGWRYVLGQAGQVMPSKS